MGSPSCIGSGQRFQRISTAAARSKIPAVSIVVNGTGLSDASQTQGQARGMAALTVGRPSRSRCSVLTRTRQNSQRSGERNRDINLLIACCPHRRGNCWSPEALRLLAGRLWWGGGVTLLGESAHLRASGLDQDGPDGSCRSCVCRQREPAARHRAGGTGQGPLTGAARQRQEPDIFPSATSLHTPYGLCASVLDPRMQFSF